MDSDGEDRPSDIVNLLNVAINEDKLQVIFAKRIKRSETMSFKLSYFLYKILFKILTGSEIKFGNFSCLPVSFVPRITNNPNFWNHYSASILKSNMPYTSVKTERGKRYSGNSKMKFNNLILHGLSSLSIYLDIIVLRLLKFTFFAILAVFLSLFTLIYIKYFTDLAIPGWTSLLFSISVNILITITFLTFLIILQHLSNRNQILSHPFEFYNKFIHTINSLKK